MKTWINLLEKNKNSSDHVHLVWNTSSSLQFDHHQIHPSIFNPNSFGRGGFVINVWNSGDFLETINSECTTKYITKGVYLMIISKIRREQIFEIPEQQNNKTKKQSLSSHQNCQMDTKKYIIYTYMYICNHYYYTYIIVLKNSNLLSCCIINIIWILLCHLLFNTWQTLISIHTQTH